MNKQTKIVCTIGPSSEKPDVLKKMIRAGMNVARLNFSHGVYDYHRALVENIRAAAKSLKAEVAILQDLQGPRVRLGTLPREGIELHKNQRVKFVYATAFSVGVIPEIPVDFPLYKDVAVGHEIFIQDGRIATRVLRVEGKIIHARVIVGGTVFTKKGINIPSTRLSVGGFTKKDQDDAIFGLSMGVDFVSLSFVENASDVRRLRTFLGKHAQGKTIPGIIVKIERREGVKNFDAILEAADGVMVARGDLGVETPTEGVPFLQKEFISKCVRAAKPVIVATHMLESMMTSPRPTRAEVSDVANAVLDHTDATMLSGESAAGMYPVEAVEYMARIHVRSEQSPQFMLHPKDEFSEPLPQSRYADIHDALVSVSEKKSCKGMVVFSEDGALARDVSRHRPLLPIFAVTTKTNVFQQLLLSFGLYPVLVTPDVFGDITKVCKQLVHDKRITKKTTAAVFSEDENMLKFSFVNC